MYLYGNGSDLCSRGIQEPTRNDRARVSLFFYCQPPEPEFVFFQMRVHLYAWNATRARTLFEGWVHGERSRRLHKLTLISRERAMLCRAGRRGKAHTRNTAGPLQAQRGTQSKTHLYGGGAIHLTGLQREIEHGVVDTQLCARLDGDWTLSLLGTSAYAHQTGRIQVSDSVRCQKCDSQVGAHAILHYFELFNVGNNGILWRNNGTQKNCMDT